MTRILTIATLLTLGFVNVAKAQFSDPACQQNLTLYYTASADGLTKNSSDEVSQLNDRSTNGFDLTQSTQSNKPIWVDDVVNGHPVLRFDGNDVLDLASVSSSDFREVGLVSIYAVVKVTGAGTVFNHESSTTAGDGKMSIESSGAYWSGDADADKADFTLTSNFQILHFTVRFEPSPFGDNLTTYIDGVEVGNEVYSSISYPGSGSNPATTGTLQIGATSGGFSGDLAELFVFNVTHAVQPREQFFTYLSLKYNIPLDHSALELDYRDSDQEILWNLDGGTSDNGCSQSNFKTEISGLISDDCYPYSSSQQWDEQHVTRFTASSFSNDDYVLWANNGEPLSNNFTSANTPPGIGSYFSTQWKVKERAGSGSIGSITVRFIITPYVTKTHTQSTIWIMVDTDDDGLYNDAASNGAAVFNPTSYSTNGGWGEFSYDFADCDAFTIGFDSPTPLPVELTQFNGELINQVVNLTWTTAQEVENDKFIIQRSSDNLKWLPIGTVEGMGTTLTSTSYSFNDENPEIGQNYYRLKQVDYNGDYAYSPIVTIEFMSEFSLDFTTFPNPAKDRLRVVNLGDFPSDKVVKFAITDIRGRIVKNGIITATTAEIDLSDVESGSYFLLLQSGLRSNRSKIIVE